MFRFTMSAQPTKEQEEVRPEGGIEKVNTFRKVNSCCVAQDDAESIYFVRYAVREGLVDTGVRPLDP